MYVVLCWVVGVVIGCSQIQCMFGGIQLCGVCVVLYLYLYFGVVYVGEQLCVGCWCYVVVEECSDVDWVCWGQCVQVVYFFGECVGECVVCFWIVLMLVVDFQWQVLVGDCWGVKYCLLLGGYCNVVVGQFLQVVCYCIWCIGLMLEECWIGCQFQYQLQFVGVCIVQLCVQLGVIGWCGEVVVVLYLLYYQYVEIMCMYVGKQYWLVCGW